MNSLDKQVGLKKKKKLVAQVLCLHIRLIEKVMRIMNKLLSLPNQQLLAEIENWLDCSF